MSARRLSVVAVILLWSSTGIAQDSFREALPEISNWTAAPFWVSTQAISLEKAKEAGALGPMAVEGVPTPPLPLIGINPCRIADTRGAGFTGAYGPPALTQGVPRNFTLTGQCGILGGAEAVSLNITVTNTQGPGFILIYPQGGAQPNVSTLNYVAGQTIANAAVVPLGTGGGVTVIAGVSGTDLIIDTNGYYAPISIVNTINGLSGAVSLAAGTNISITPAGQTLTVAATNVDASSLGGQPATFYDQAPPPPSGNTRTSLNSADDVGQYTSVTIGADGLGLVSYWDVTNFDLNVAHCSNVNCTSATTTPLDTTGNVGQYTSVTIGADGLGLISYYDNTNLNLKVAHCSNVNCTAATITPLDTTGSVGQSTSVTIGADGLGLISYYDETNQDVKVAHCSNVNCTSATTTPIDTTAGFDTAITIGADGLGLISYIDLISAHLKVAHCSNTNCSAATITPIDTTDNVGFDSSVTIGADGLGLISYHDGTNDDLKVAHCSNVNCTAATITPLDTTGSVGQYTSVTIGADSLGLISYYDSPTGDLKVAHCSNVTCTAATLTSLPTAEQDGFHTSVTIGADGLGLISNYDVSNGNLQVAHCSNTLCTPFFRRR
ncbi:MAG TPA: hypothetical protein VGS98_15480 [Thermoanaerobaculia bacterium]|jgi:cell shape-determining protein MreC|nr:hypothetical protein [Thermoanaerobaculia bacterium]